MELLKAMVVTQPLGQAARKFADHTHHSGEPSSAASVSIDLNRDTVKD